MQTVIGAFDTSAQAERAAQELVNAGIARDDISLIANNSGGQYAPITNTANDGTTMTGHAVGHDAVVGAEWGAGIGFLVGLSGFAIPGLGWVAGAGWLYGLIVGAASGAVIGGLVGALTQAGVPEADAYRYHAAVQHGSILLAIRAQDADAHRVADILDREGAINIDERVDQYQQAGYLPANMATSTNNTTMKSPVMAGTTMGDMQNRGVRSYNHMAGQTVNPSGNYANTGAYTGAGTNLGAEAGHVARNAAADVTGTVERAEGSLPGIQTGGRAYDGTPDTRGITEKAADAFTGDRIDDKTGKPV
jgi:hypothetical protein